MCLSFTEGWRDQPPEPDGWEAEGADAQTGGGTRILFYNIWWFDWMAASIAAITNVATQSTLIEYLLGAVYKPIKQ